MLEQILTQRGCGIPRDWASFLDRAFGLPTIPLPRNLQPAGKDLGNHNQAQSILEVQGTHLDLGGTHFDMSGTNFDPRFTSPQDLSGLHRHDYRAAPITAFLSESQKREWAESGVLKLRPSEPASAHHHVEGAATGAPLAAQPDQSGHHIADQQHSPDHQSAAASDQAGTSWLT
ncbi:hypothetical protein [Rhodoligotrophos defluvii]|uniref:hypothetical protein n=1 Tax=Rhodoligotrophos defluvii TaxID=2561934 RepID=UPI0010CA1763|nr:hypothetical protein [Rhodoligotrophos defluvii]